MTFTVFANLTAGNQSAGLLDTAFSNLGACAAIPCPTVAGSANAIVLTASTTYIPATSISLATLLTYVFSFIANSTSTGPVTINVSNTGTLNLYLPDGVTQANAGHVIAGAAYLIVYNYSLNSFAGGYQLIAFPAPGLQFIASAAASNSATVSFTGLSTLYKTLMLEFDSVVNATTNEILLLQLGIGATPTWDTTAGDYETSLIQWSGSSSAVSANTTSAGIAIAGSGATAPDNSHPVKGQVTFGNVTQSAELVQFDGSVGFYNTATVGGKYTAVWSPGGITTAIRVLSSSGNITSGNFRLYGLRNT